MMKRFWLSCLCIGISSGLFSAEESRRVRIARENAPAVVAINVLYPSAATFTGTGFVLTPEGLIATNRHVIEGASYVNVTFSDGTISAEAVPVSAASQVDLALLKIPAKHLRTVKVVSSADVEAGQSITVIGNPRRLQNTVSSGLISQVRKKPDGTLWHQISAPISPSSSGSPVFNRQGEVISIAFASYAGENNQNLNFAVPSDYLLQLVRESGYTLPPTASTAAQAAPASNALVRHIQKAWAILRQMISRFRTKDPTRT